MTWTRIDCARSDEVYEAIENRAPLAGRSDMGGSSGWTGKTQPSQPQQSDTTNRTWKGTA